MIKFHHIQDILHKELLRKGISRKNLAGTLEVEVEKVGSLLEKGANPKVKLVLRALNALGLKWEVASEGGQTAVPETEWKVKCAFCSKPLQHGTWVRISMGSCPRDWRGLCEACGKHARTHFLLERNPTTDDVCEPVDPAFEKDDQW